MWRSGVNSGRRDGPSSKRSFLQRAFHSREADAGCPDDVGGGGGVAAAFDGFVDEGSGFSQGSEDVAYAVDHAFAPAQFSGQLLVVGRQLDQVYICGAAPGICDLGDNPVGDLNESREESGNCGVMF